MSVTTAYLTRRGSGVFFRYAAVVAVLGASLYSATGRAADATIPGPTKPLSKPNIHIIGPNAQSFSPIWIAKDKGFFTQQGLNVETTVSKGAAITYITVMLSGSADFMQGASAAQILAAESGAPVKAVIMATAPSGQFMAINQKVATDKKVPPEAKTPDEAVAQLKALKGSKITIGVEGPTADTYAWMLYMFKELGMTVGAGGDVAIKFTGSPLNNVAAFNSGQVEAIASALPYSSQPNSVRIPLFRIPPATNAAGQYLITTNPLIKDHPDTVQAVVNAVTLASQFVREHPDEAFKVVQPHLVAAGYDDIELQRLMFYTGYAQFAQLSYPFKNAYDNQITLLNSGNAANNKGLVKLTWDKFVDTRFAEKTLKQLNLPIPTN